MITVTDKAGTRLLEAKLDDEHWVVWACAKDAQLVRLPYYYSNAGIMEMLWYYERYGCPERSLFLSLTKTAARR
jgi:hypothetical protein